jgi:hypothetical protein
MNRDDVSRQTSIQPLDIDRTKWGPGPWDGEPDRIDFEAHGFPCLMLRNSFGAWCGYVAVPREHPAYGRGYDEMEVQVHGGLTYADQCRGHICHEPKAGQSEDVWWVGFDCAHSGDMIPAFRRGFSANLGETYRTVSYVRREVENLANQLKVLA